MKTLTLNLLPALASLLLPFSLSAEPSPAEAYFAALLPKATKSPRSN